MRGQTNNKTKAYVMLRSSFGIVLIVMTLTNSSALAEQRYALVIGNGAYENIDRLANPPKDVRLVSETLEAVGFEVTLLVDANKRQMDDAARKFARALDDAGRNTVGLFYFAGHGVSYEGENWLIPVGADIREGVDIVYATVSANKVLRLMEGARNATDILILDACRNSPFRGFSLSGTRAVTRGMSRMDAPAGSYIAYSTAPGAVAYDGPGDYSPFAAAFAAEIKTPGVSIGDMMIDVRNRVKESTKGLGSSPQTPWDASSLTGRFAFSPGPAAVQNGGSAQAVPQSQQLDVASLRQPLAGAEERYWLTVKDSQDSAEYESYLKKYPAGEFADIAKARRDRYTVDPATGADVRMTEIVAFDKHQQACSPKEIAGTYKASWGPITCKPAGAALECCYSSNCEWTLRLALADGGKMLEGLWDHNDGRTGPVEFKVNDRCELSSGSYGYEPGKLTRGWPVGSKIDN